MFYSCLKKSTIFPGKRHCRRRNKFAFLTNTITFLVLLCNRLEFSNDKTTDSDNIFINLSIIFYYLRWTTDECIRFILRTPLAVSAFFAFYDNIVVVTLVILTFGFIVSLLYPQPKMLVKPYPIHSPSLISGCRH